MRLLFDDKLAPLTSAMGFFEADHYIAVESFVKWCQEIDEPHGVSIVRRAVTGNLEDVLRTLLPFSREGQNRFLFIPTTSHWTAYVANSSLGTDQSAVGYMAERLGCRSMYTVAIPHTLSKIGTPRRGRQGALILDVYGPEKTEWLNLIRSIALFNDAGKWEFQVSGTPFPFERTGQYAARRRKDRFTFDMLQDYLAELGLSPFEESFYLPPDKGAAELVELSGGYLSKLTELTLEQAREHY